MTEDAEAPFRSLKARWIFPGDGPPIENGTIVLADGRIAELHAANDPRAVDLGNAAIIPALVNAHTHLELSDLARPLEPAARFADWIRSVIAHRRSRRSAVEPVSRGAVESVHAGTTLLADIVTDDAAPMAYPSEGPGVIAFRELIGLLPDQAEGQLDTARGFLEASNAGGAVVARGLSPHAPYSVGPELYHQLVSLSRERGVPLAVHLAETPAELELLRDGTGELAAMLESLGASSGNVIPRGSRPMNYLRPLAGLDRALVVHGNYLDQEELAFVAEHPQLTIVYCPRTHAFFGHHEHPWPELLSRGASVALGTDSRASNPDLSLFAEMRFLRRRFPDMDPRLLLRLGTLAGARALGFGEVTGSLTPGKSADLAVAALPSSGPADAFDLLFDAESRIVRVMHAGRWVEHRTGVDAVAV